MQKNTKAVNSLMKRNQQITKKIREMMTNIMIKEAMLEKYIRMEVKRKKHHTRKATKGKNLKLKKYVDA